MPAAPMLCQTRVQILDKLAAFYKLYGHHVQFEVLSFTNDTKAKLAKMGGEPLPNWGVIRKRVSGNAQFWRIEDLYAAIERHASQQPQPDKLDHQTVSFILDDLRTQGYPLDEMTRPAIDLYGQLLAWFKAEGADSVVEPYWASMVSGLLPKHVYDYAVELAVNKLLVINRQFGQPSSYGLPQAIQMLFPEQEPVLEPDMTELEESKVVEIKPRRENKWNRERCIEQLARVTLMKGSYPTLCDSWRGAIWDERTTKIGQLVGGIPHYTTANRYVGPMAIVRKEIDAYIERTKD